MTSTSQKVYFITGANRGIGFEFVRQLSEDPANTVIATTRDIKKSNKLVNLVKEHPNVKLITLDIAKKDSIHSVPGQLKDIGITIIDTFIQNAGLYNQEIYKPVINVDYATYVHFYKVNTLGPIELFKVLKPFLDRSSIKQVVFVSSVAGSIGEFLPISTSAYGHSKAALNHSVRGLAFELDAEGYTILAIHPGVVLTENASETSESVGIQYPEFKDYIEQYSMSPEDSAKAQLKTLENLVSGEGNDKFLNYDGTEIPW